MWKSNVPLNSAFKQPPLLRQRGLLILLAAGWLVISACNKKQASEPDHKAHKPQQASEASRSVPGETSATTGSTEGTLTLPTGLGKRTGDLDEMMKHRSIRALVIVDPINFFYQAGQPHGIEYEALQEFEKFVNQKQNTGKLPVKVVFLPMRLDQLEPALTEGLGDMIAYQVIVTPEREQHVAFSVPVQTNVSQIVVTGQALANVSSFDDLAGKEVYVNPLTNYYDNLQKLNESRRQAGKPLLTIKAADKDLSDDDLVQMVNAGLIPATITRKGRADLWAQVLPNIKSHPDLAVASEGETAWVMRKNNPQLKALVDEFMQTHAAGTAFGNTLLRRYLQNTKWVKNATSPEEMQKFNAYVQFFKKYAGQYNFDYLMLAAQGYQESLLDQGKRSPVGAVGIMQVMPKLAAANPINVPNVGDAGGNIQAGAKMLRNITDTYFNDPAIDPLNKTLFTFASYNAGPSRIVRLREKAKADGLDPNKWFGNVELEVAKDVGQETVTYVSNIYKYYVAYKLTNEQKQDKKTTE